MTDPNAKGHNAPCSNRDFDFFYRGLEEGKLLVQKCTGCGQLLKPKAGDCCVFCSYGSAPCPPFQAGTCCN